MADAVLTSSQKKGLDECCQRFFQGPGVAISTCDLALHPVHGPPEVCKKLPKGIYAVKNHYTWDSWAADSTLYDGT